jgi:uracil-DNA glycosylase
LNPDSVKISAAWKEALKAEFEAPYFDEITRYIRKAIADGKTIYPPGRLIFNAYDLVPPQNVKVVILGQDPYHNPGEAMGLCFSVPHGINIPPSLKNIYKELNEDLACRMGKSGGVSVECHPYSRKKPARLTRPDRVAAIYGPDHQLSF